MKPFTERWKVSPMLAPLAMEVGRMARFLNGTKFVVNGRVEKRGSGMLLYGTPGGGVKSPFAVNAGTALEDVTITGGVLEWMGKLSTYTLADSQQEVTGGTAIAPHYIYIEFDGSTLSAPATAATTRPVSDDTKYRKVLAYAWLDTSGDDDKAVILSPRRWIGGDIECWWGV